MSVLDRLFSLADRVRAPRVAHAHCDIPCGIYDPHLAQLAALTVVRMVQLMEGLEVPADAQKPAAIATYTMQIARYAAVKEEYAKLCEHELVVLWSDYFKPEHLEQYPNLHDLFWKTMKLTSTVKQQIDMDSSQQLLAGCQQIAEIFWATKGVQSRRQPSFQGAAGGELVLPVAG